MATFGLKIAFPAPTVSDVGSRELTVTTNGSVQTLTFPGTALSSDEIVFPSDANVSVTLVDVDTHGNRSLPSAVLNFAVNDDVPPPQPGALGIDPASKRQID